MVQYVHDLMTTHPVTMAPDTPVRQAATSGIRREGERE